MTTSSSHTICASDLITRREVVRITSLSLSSIRRREQRGEFPRSVRLGTTSVGRCAYVRREIEEFIAAHAARRPQFNHKESDMQNVSSEIMNAAKFAVNRRTGVFFVAHADMFHKADPDGNRWSIPEDMEFFTDHDEAKKLSDSILADLALKNGSKTDPRVSTPPLLAPDGDSKRLPSKSEVARIAKERYGVTIEINRSRRCVDAQYLAASVAHASGVDPQGAVNAQALAEGDQLTAAA